LVKSKKDISTKHHYKMVLKLRILGFYE